MKRDQVREIGLFFLMGFMDEKVALAAASRCVAKVKASQDSASTQLEAVEMIKICRDAWKTFRKQIPRNQPLTTPADSWVVPEDLDISIWARYQKDAADEDVMALLFSLVLGVSDQDLAEGFQTSVGTIRYRLGKGVRQLGLVVRTQPSRATT
jgi:hypothetical protein